MKKIYRERRDFSNDNLGEWDARLHFEGESGLVFRYHKADGLLEPVVEGDGRRAEQRSNG